MLSRLNRLTRPAIRAYSQCAILSDIAHFNATNIRPATRAYSQCAILSDGAHFNATNIKHPLMPTEKKKYTEADLGDHTGRLQNYVWTKEEISEKMKTLYRHVSHSLTHSL